MTLSTNKKIFIPFREDSTNTKSAMKDTVEKYYKQFNYEIVLLDSGDDQFNLSKSRNLAFTEYEEEDVILINADCILPNESINSSLDIIKDKNIVVKPFLRIFRFDKIDENILNIIINNEILEEPIKSQSNDFFPGGAFILNKDVYKKIGGFNENILDARISSLEFCLRVASELSLYFLSNDAYTFHHVKQEDSDQIKKCAELYNIHKYFLNNKKDIHLIDINNRNHKMDEEINKIELIFNLNNIIYSWND